jgi:cell division protein FtsB
VKDADARNAALVIQVEKLEAQVAEENAQAQKLVAEKAAAKADAAAHVTQGLDPIAA